MASYQTRGRDPLLDQNTQAAIERRSKELLGLLLAGIGILFAMLLVSYSPDDPNFMLASDGPVQNWLGRMGASIAHPLHMIIGIAGWGVPMVLITWGMRLALHRGEERLMGRLPLSPLWIALLAVFCATMTPGPNWAQSFGLGGLFGDTVLGLLLTVVPFGTTIAVKLWAVALLAGTAMFGAWALGFTRPELQLAWRWALAGLVLAYEMVLRAAGQGAVVATRAATRAAVGVQARVGTAIETRREARAAQPQAARSVAQVTAYPEEYIEQPRAMPPGARTAASGLVQRPAAMMMPAEPPLTAPPMATPAPQRAMPVAVAAPLVAPVRAAAVAAPLPEGGFLANLLRRAAPQAAPAAPVDDASDAPADDRIRSRIADAIRARSGAEEPHPEPPVTRPRGPRPLILDTTPRPQPQPQPVPQAPMAIAQDIAPAMPPAPVMPPRTLSRVAAPPPLLIEEDDDDDEDAMWAPPAAPVPRAPMAAERPRIVQPAVRRATPPSSRAKAEAQPQLPLEDRFANWEFPPLSLLTNPASVERHHLSDEALEENARMLESVLDDYGVKGEIVSVRPGPVVTMYELEPAPGLKASRVIGLADDIARSMSALSARVSTVPGRSVIGIELPNVKREKVVLREIISARDFGDSQMRLPLALGKDIAGEPIVANLAKMPHLLIAGTTGSGKSVAINTMILSLLYKLTPQECRLIMIDPKMLELSVYDGIPHLLSPVVTDPKKAVVALKWVVGEMEERYRKMSKMGVRNIEGYNGRVRDALDKGEMFSRTVQTGFDEETGDPIFETDEFQPELLPYIVVIVDEMADLMMVAGKEIEACIQRLAQMARASGIHLIMATQRPSVDVITGTIKANFPTRISFQVTSKIDSRTILGEMGAEQLLGMGDMLYMAGGGRITRIHGPFCSDEEVEEIVNHLKAFGPPEYMSGVIEGPSDDREDEIDQMLGLSASGGNETDDAMYDMAVQIVAKDRKCSTSYIQRKLAIGYNKAARLVEQMEEQGVVTPANHVGKREILVPELH
jgi:S-DNA-T family DNA segregation ATPase FtsK/SpoIIIE